MCPKVKQFFNSPYHLSIYFYLKAPIGPRVDFRYSLALNTTLQLLTNQSALFPRSSVSTLGKLLFITPFSRSRFQNILPMLKRTLIGCFAEKNSHNIGTWHQHNICLYLTATTKRACRAYSTLDEVLYKPKW